MLFSPSYWVLCFPHTLFNRIYVKVKLIKVWVVGGEGVVKPICASISSLLTRTKKSHWACQAQRYTGWYINSISAPPPSSTTTLSPRCSCCRTLWLYAHNHPPLNIHCYSLHPSNSSPLLILHFIFLLSILDAPNSVIPSYIIKIINFTYSSCT